MEMKGWNMTIAIVAVLVVVVVILVVIFRNGEKDNSINNDPLTEQIQPDDTIPEQESEE